MQELFFNECDHPEVKRGAYIKNKNVNPRTMYCLACGDALKHRSYTEWLARDGVDTSDFENEMFEGF